MTPVVMAIYGVQVPSKVVIFGPNDKMMKILRKADKVSLKAELLVLSGYIKATFDRNKSKDLFDVQMSILKEIGERFGVDDLKLLDNLEE